LARLEITATLDALAEAGVTRIEPAGDVQRSRSTIIAGVTHAPLTLLTK
jgi:hypothetical protein